MILGARIPKNIKKIIFRRQLSIIRIFCEQKIIQWSRSDEYNRFGRRLAALNSNGFGWFVYEMNLRVECLPMCLCLSVNVC